MIRIVFLIKKRPDLTLEQFRDYYETKHVPLAREIFPMYAEYTRKYIKPIPGFGEESYAAITEIGFANQADYDWFLRICADPVVMDRIRADEAHFLISSENRAVRVEGFAASEPGEKVGPKPAIV